jgi:Flp pilus assembly protein TadG
MANNCKGSTDAFLQWLRQGFGQEEGAALVYVTLVFPVLLMLAGLAMDGSNLYVQQRRVQNAADSAALAGARAIALGQTNAQISNEVNDLVTANGATIVGWNYINQGKGIQVQAMRTFATFFAQVMGYETLTVQSSASAQFSAVTSGDNLLPMTMMCDDVDSDADSGFQYGATYTLWSNDMTQPGNFGWVDWNGTPVGTDELAANILNPSNSGSWAIGDWIPAGPGVRAALPVREALDTWIGQTVTIPLYDVVTGNGSNVQYRVCSFAEFILLEYNFSGSSKWVRGQFSRTVQRGGGAGGNPPDFGVRTVRLVQ